MAIARPTAGGTTATPWENECSDILFPRRTPRIDDDDRRLFEQYLQSGGPDAGPWNRSPRCLYLEYWTRNEVVERFGIFSGVRVCNVGIGAGEWDNFLCDWLNGRGRLTSINIDPSICSLFAYRQKREGHRNPAAVVCADILTAPLRPLPEHFAFPEAHGRNMEGNKNSRMRSLRRLDLTGGVHPVAEVVHGDLGVAGRGLAIAAGPHHAELAVALLVIEDRLDVILFPQLRRLS